MLVRFYISSIKCGELYAGCLRAEGDGTPGVIELLPFEDIGFPPEQHESWRAWYEHRLKQLYREFDRYQIGYSYPKPLRPWLRDTILQVLKYRLGAQVLRGEVVTLDREQPLENASA